MKKRNCYELLKQYKLEKNSNKAEKLKLIVENEKDIYNITAPFEMDGKNVIAGRVEARDSEHSKIMFFEEMDNKEWRVIEDAPVFDLQDPFYSRINGEIVLGGVEIYETGKAEMPICYRTIFMKGKNLNSLKRFAVGPDRMKDIRLLQLNKNMILVLTRPQGEVGGRGKIAYTFINSLEELTIEKIESATVIEDMFYEDEWGGANELHLLEDGSVGVLSHIAKFDEEGNRHYYSSVFNLNPKTLEHSPMRLIAVRADFEDGVSKRPDLIDVIFSGGLIRKENGQAELYCGVSDAEAHKILICDPFKI